LELLNRVERRVTSEEANGRVQSAARKQQQREAGTGLLIVDADRASFVELAPLASLLSKYARHGGRCRSCNTGGNMLRLVESIISVLLALAMVIERGLSLSRRPIEFSDSTG
jgi:hypothetical protein